MRTRLSSPQYQSLAALTNKCSELVQLHPNSRLITARRFLMNLPARYRIHSPILTRRRQQTRNAIMIIKRDRHMNANNKSSRRITRLQVSRHVINSRHISKFTLPTSSITRLSTPHLISSQQLRQLAMRHSLRIINRPTISDRVNTSTTFRDSSPMSHSSIQASRQATQFRRRFRINSRIPVSHSRRSIRMLLST